MGQYYYGVILSDKCRKNNTNKGKILACITSYDYECMAKLMEHSYINNPMVNAMEALINTENGKYAGQPILWAGDYADEETVMRKQDNKNIYCLCYEDESLAVKGVTPIHYRYVINETKHQFVDTNNVPEFDGWRIHPLPILCCEGNGMGGGDYSGDNMQYVGIWARNVVVVSNEKPDDTYKEIKPDFKEEW